MLENLSLQYPSWYLIFCPLVGLGLAGLLYFRENRFSEEKPWLPGVLFLLRFLLLTGIVLLLLSPLIKSVKDNIQEPIIVFAKDVSSSIIAEKSTDDISLYNDQINNMIDRLEEKYDVKSLSFGDQVESGNIDTFTQKVTNLSRTFDYITENFADQNIGAVILSSDGIFNEGKNPLYSINSITAPIFVIAQGDTTRRTDLAVRNTFANRIVYLNDRFSLQVDIQAYSSRGKSSRLQIQKINATDRREVYRENFSITDEDFFTTKEIILDADEVGVLRYRISLSPIAGEVTTSNNYKDIYIQVLDARQKVLILAQAPHPDLSGISQLISQNRNYETTIKFKKNRDYNVAEYDQVIFHNLPGNRQRISSELTILQKNRIPYLFIIGAQMDIRTFNQVQDIIKINSNGKTLENVVPLLNQNFKSFTTSDKMRNSLQSFPPLLAPFGEYTISDNATTMLYQNIRSIDTKYPLISFQEKNGIKTGVIIGEGIWKWRLFDYLQNENYELTTELLNKVIQFISRKKDNRKFIVTSSKNLYRENETIAFSAQLYNDNYELVNEPEVFLSVFGPDNQEYQYILDRNNDFYSLNIGLLSPGRYRFNAKTNFNGQEFTDRGNFSIQEIQLETFDLEARHSALAALTERANGALFYENQIADLTQEILSRESIKPVMYQNVKTTPLINLKWLFFILLILLTCEWFLRRFFGSY